MSKTHYHFDGMSWPRPTDLTWSLTYGAPTRAQLLHAASIIGAYCTLVTSTREKRDRVVRELRRAPMSK